MIPATSMALEIDLLDSTAVKRLNYWFDLGWEYEDGFPTPNHTVLLILSRGPVDDDDDDDDDFDDPYTR